MYVMVCISLTPILYRHVGHKVIQKEQVLSSWFDFDCYMYNEILGSVAQTHTGQMSSFVC